MVNSVVFIGAGRLATNLALALSAQGCHIVQVYSRTIESAHALASRIGCDATDSISAVKCDADAYIVAVKDSVLPELLPQLAEGRAERMFFHTAGSVPLDVFAPYFQHFGVIYPMQTFSKERLVDFAHLPIFIEANGEASLSVAREIATMVSDNVSEVSSHQRSQLHLAAVFACNFANHCYALADEVLRRCGLPFSSMQSLIDETAAKVHEMAPRQAQTGPAVRFDENVIQRQMQMLSDAPLMRDVYELMSRSIHDLVQNETK